MFDNMFTSTRYLKNGLDASMLRNEVIANNMANVNTPDFKASTVEFESLFRSALEDASGSTTMKRTRPGHRPFGDTDISDVRASVTQRTDTVMRMDGNNVDIDIEASEQAKNALYYNTLITKLNGEYTRIRLAITGR